MNTKIKWLLIGLKIDRKKIKEIEKKIGIKFPEDYIDCVVNNHGGTPKKKAYDFKDRKEAVFNRLLSYNDESPINILKIYNLMKSYLPKYIIPFAEDPFGNNICFDYRENKSSPKVVFWDHEVAGMNPDRAIQYICESFTELLEKLYDPDEE